MISESGSYIISEAFIIISDMSEMILDVQYSRESHRSLAFYRIWHPIGVHITGLLVTTLVGLLSHDCVHMIMASG